MISRVDGHNTAPDTRNWSVLKLSYALVNFLYPFPPLKKQLKIDIIYLICAICLEI